MQIRMENGLPIVSVEMKHGGKSVFFTNVLLDTGCATTIFDTDALSQIGIELDIINGKTKRMYGVGGYSELCYEQNVNHLTIDGKELASFSLQLGMIREWYGFDGILGSDFMLRAGLIIRFKNLTVEYE
ncbi:hypothetical protein GGR02_002844 [Anoxybacillus voinovskiensis]|uniref:Peptidase A2 domain-containing protein n=1 Tax=Anoxybacteroides voinovskiense TaxID=230470 RepID=A0A840DTR0_9BACL|nr:aspartyl protease family protein [Anoxybacillus voinovskiensis]MBB4075043.1 hypothetical protein [Anoxybacillus voinovskiensis]GGJ76428.1 hypothetical protein GCM10008982_27120 [Anoxybacillus voinovskiensis]